jgi:hypothetical protein
MRRIRARAGHKLAALAMTGGVGNAMQNRHSSPVTQPAAEPQAVEALIAYAFAPVHHVALGVAFGLTAGALTALITLLQLLFEDGVGLPLGLLGQFFYGYEVSAPGALVGFAWAFATGFVAGWFVGFLKNLCTAVWVFVIRAKAELTQPFLDHL